MNVGLLSPAPRYRYNGGFRGGCRRHGSRAVAIVVVPQKETGNMRSMLFRKAIHGLALGAVVLAAARDGAVADTRPVTSRDDIGRLPTSAARLYAEATLIPRPKKYEEIPWLVDLNAGIAAAKKENRPLLIWVSGDDPLERC